jgi:hypothetical protein
MPMDSWTISCSPLALTSMTLWLCLLTQQRMTAHKCHFPAQTQLDTHVYPAMVSNLWMLLMTQPSKFEIDHSSNLHGLWAMGITLSL